MRRRWRSRATHIINLTAVIPAPAGIRLPRRPETIPCNRRDDAPWWWLWVALTLLFAGPALAAPTFPPLTGRVTDAANVLPADVRAQLDARLVQLEAQTGGTQLVVATIPSLQDYDIADYGYQLGRAWGIGQQGKNTGALLIIAPNDRKVRIEVGYGLEGVLTDALSNQIIQEAILPRFKAGDLPGGVVAGTDRLIAQLQLPPEQAAQVAQAAAAQPHRTRGDGGGPGWSALIWIVVIVVFAIISSRRGRRGRRYGRGGLPIVIWGPGGGWGGGGGFGGGGFGGGGFGGGGGSFGGGGSSGSW